MAVADGIDRIAPSLEPDARAVMHQTWHHLLFLHWEIPPEELQRALPPQLTVDTFEGIAYVGLVPFTVSGVRAVMTPPLPWISSFHEVNVRTYVHRDGRDPGVWFFSLDASSAIAVAAARAAYKLPYFHSHIEFFEAADESPSQIDFASQRHDSKGPTPADMHVRYRAMNGIESEAPAGTLEHFLIERYILYTADERQQVYRARVHHAPYPLQRAEVVDLDESLVRAAGLHRAQSNPLRHYARELRVQVYGLERV